MESKRSKELTAIGIFFILFAMVGFIVLVMYSPRIVQYHSLIVIYNALYYVVLLIAGIGILLIKKWARIMALVLVAMKTLHMALEPIMVRKILESAQATKSYPISSMVVNILIPLFIGAGIIYYLTRPKVKEQFK